MRKTRLAAAAVLALADVPAAHAADWWVVALTRPGACMPAPLSPADWMNFLAHRGDAASVHVVRWPTGTVRAAIVMTAPGQPYLPNTGWTFTRDLQDCLSIANRDLANGNAATEELQ
jgi:hypothetical protein